MIKSLSGYHIYERYMSNGMLLWCVITVKIGITYYDIELMGGTVIIRCQVIWWNSTICTTRRDFITHLDLYIIQWSQILNLLSVELYISACASIRDPRQFSGQNLFKSSLSVGVIMA